MGQEHSVPSPRNRLSKPKTNNSALNLLSRSALHLDRKDAPLRDVPGQENRYTVVFADSEARVDLVKEEKQQKESKRRSIFRSFTTPDKNLDARIEKEVEQETGEHQVYQWNDQTRKSSIADELHIHEEKTRPLNRSRMSLQHVPNTQSQQRLSLVAEALTPAEELPNRLSTYAELRSPQITNPIYTRTSSETDLYPVRRRSLLQHGVATRPVIANDARQSLPSQARQQDDSEYSKPSPYPLAYLNSLKQEDIPRVETPDELGYRHTGAFKLGSLVITNGVASPTPSVERASTMAGDDYISAGHMRRFKEGHQRDASNRSNTMSIPGERMKAPWIVHEESPLRQAEKYESALNSKLPDLDRSLANFDFDYTLHYQMHSPTRSQDLANEYIEEISSPYSFVPSRTPSPRLEPTTKHTALEDELFDAEPLTPALSHAPSSADSGYGGTSQKSSGIRQKPLAKADSGYSSNISLRSFKTNGSRAPPVPAKDVPRTPPSKLGPRDSLPRVPSTSYSYNSMDENINTRTPLPVLSTDQKSFGAPLTQSYTPEGSYPPRTPTKSNEQIAVRSYPQQEPQPRKLSLTDGLRSNPISKANQKHSRSGSDPKPLGVAKLLSYKKEKPRPYSVQPEMRQIFTQSQRRDEPINAPPVPYETSRSLEDRVDSFPVVSFNNAFRGLRRTGSKETLGTIFSVGSGYTDVPRGQELTKSRLQEALPAPPTPLRKVVSNSSIQSAHLSRSNSNSYYPPKTPPRKLQKKPSAQDMAAYGQLDLTVTKKLSYQSIRSSVDDTLRVAKRSQSFSEMGVETGRLTVRNVSGESSTSVASAALTTKQSYGSIAARNPYDTSRKSSLDTLPSMINASLSSDHLNVDNNAVRRLSWGNRDKKQPPVSMQTQRKVTPAPQPSYNNFPSPSRRPHPTPLTPISKDVPPMIIPDRPPPPPQKSPLYLPQLPLQEVSPFPSPLLPYQDSPREPWAEQKMYGWSDRRNSGNSIQQERPILKQRSSTSSIQQSSTNPMQLKQPVPDRNSTSTLQSRGGRRPPSVHQNSNLRIQKNIEVVKARIHSENKMYMQSNPDLRYQNESDQVRREADEQIRQNRERDRAGEMLAGWAVSPGGTTPGEYHHTYGFQAPVVRPRSPEKEYFSQPEEVDFYGDYHQRQSSTQDMLVLDRFSGGVGYGYDPYGMQGGNGGSRNTGSRGQRTSLNVYQGY